LHFREIGSLWEDVGPMILPFRALLDPASEEIDLIAGKTFAGFGGGHAVIFVFGGDELDHFALARSAGNDGVISRLKLFERFLFEIEAQAGFALVFVRAMAGVAV